MSLAIPPADPQAPAAVTALPTVADLKLLATLTQDFIGTPDLEQTLQRAVRQTTSYLGAEAASLFLLDTTERRLICRACAGPVDVTGLTLALDDGIVGLCVRTNAVRMVRDVTEDASFHVAVDNRTGFCTRSILCAPLQIKGRMLGALEVLNKRSGDGLFNVSDQDFIETLAGIISLAIHNAQMAAALVEQERMRRELELAREIQLSLLPADAPAGFPVHGLNHSALEVSGDFYDVFSLPDGNIVWGLGDVSGKGMNAALLMSRTLSLFRCLARSGRSPADLLAQLNAELVESASHGMFVTMIAGRYDPSSDLVELANAGHPPALLRTAQGAWRALSESAPPLGILADIEYTNQQLRLNDGRLYVFSDGVTEGRTASGAMLGMEGLRAQLDAHARIPPAAQIAQVAAVICSAAPSLHDDLTLLVVGA